MAYGRVSRLASSHFAISFLATIVLAYSNIWRVLRPHRISQRRCGLQQLHTYVNSNAALCIPYIVGGMNGAHKLGVTGGGGSERPWCDVNSPPALIEIKRIVHNGANGRIHMSTRICVGLTSFLHLRSARPGHVTDDYFSGYRVGKPGNKIGIRKTRRRPLGVREWVFHPEKSNFARKSPTPYYYRRMRFCDRRIA
ncbi:hypothetical protein EVAR_42063_1 [Eumeta japonica]|uniref:Uncharacterized protein n=1 Tax=Eumeta variegata TaxID=151549 RepID=A0A4C1XX11_EUMVA|nr:hypothetical protein EVAR_42063_1 [Eumeta japonica]